VADLVWRKATASANSSDCVEVAWRKASASLSNCTCVEAGMCACDEPRAWVRNSHQPNGTVLAFDPADWVALVDAVCGGQLPDGLTYRDGHYLLSGTRHDGGTGMVRYTTAEWEAFTDGCRRGEFSLDALQQPQEVTGG
jgi:hypothetical protein